LMYAKAQNQLYRQGGVAGQALLPLYNRNIVSA
jgi:hypothetical protein